MQKVMRLTKLICLTLFFLNSNLLIKSEGAVPSEIQVESTLEVLQGARLGPSNRMLCGPICLYIGAKCLSIERYSVDDIAIMTDWNYMEGTSMLGLEKACQRMGLYAEVFKLNIDQLGKLMTENNALAVVEDQNHYYLFMKAHNVKFLVVTTPVRPEWVEAERIADIWNGKALLFSKQPINVENMPRRRLLLSAGLGGSLLMVIVIVRYFWVKHNQTQAK